MARLPLIPIDPSDEITRAVFAGFAEEGREPIALYRVLANAPRMLEAYSYLARRLRHDARSSRLLRELVILRTAQLTGSEYEWSHHRAMARQLDLPEAKIKALWRWDDSPEFDERERCVLRCADEIHSATLSSEAFDDLRRLFEPDEIIEIVLVAAFYQAVARLLQAIDVEVEPEYHGYLEPWGGGGAFLGRNGDGADKARADAR